MSEKFAQVFVIAALVFLLLVIVATMFLPKHKKVVYPPAIECVYGCIERYDGEDVKLDRCFEGCQKLGK